MLSRSRLKPKRDTPRRNEGRVQHERMKAKAGAKATAEERRHLDRIAAMPCLVAGCTNAANIHHVVSDGFKRISRTHRLATPLCKIHHQDGPMAVHRIGHAKFTEVFGIDLLTWAEEAWEETQKEKAK